MTVDSLAYLESQLFRHTHISTTVKTVELWEFWSVSFSYCSWSNLTRVGRSVCYGKWNHHWIQLSSLLNKTLNPFIRILDAIHLAFSVHGFYWYGVTNFMHPEIMAYGIWWVTTELVQSLSHPLYRSLRVNHLISSRAEMSYRGVSRCLIRPAFASRYVWKFLTNGTHSDSVLRQPVMWWSEGDFPTGGCHRF